MYQMLLECPPNTFIVESVTLLFSYECIEGGERWTNLSSFMNFP